MSRQQWITLLALGVAVAMVFGCMGALVLLYLTGSLATETGTPVQAVDTAVPGPTIMPTPPRASEICQSVTQDYFAEIQPLLEDWQDTVEVANSTSRIALSPVVQDMQAIRRDIADVPVPDCAQDASGLLLIGLGDVVDSFLDFMADSETDSAIAQSMNMGLLEMTAAIDQLTSLTKGMEVHGDDEGYAVCAEGTLSEARRLDDEANKARSQARREQSAVFCSRTTGWVQRAENLHATHEACPIPLDPHLQAARMWLEMGYADIVEAMHNYADWCSTNPQALTHCDAGCLFESDAVTIDQGARFEFSIERAEREIGRF